MASTDKVHFVVEEAQRPAGEQFEPHAVGRHRQQSGAALRRPQAGPLIEINGAETYPTEGELRLLSTGEEENPIQTILGPDAELILATVPAERHIAVTSGSAPQPLT